MHVSENPARLCVSLASQASPLGGEARRVAYPSLSGRSAAHTCTAAPALAALAATHPRHGRSGEINGYDPTAVSGVPWPLSMARPGPRRSPRPSHAQRVQHSQSVGSVSDGRPMGRPASGRHTRGGRQCQCSAIRRRPPRPTELNRGPLALRKTAASRKPLD